MKKQFLVDPTTGTNAREVRWGDFLKVTGESGKFVVVTWGAKTYHFPKAQAVETRPLEIVFLDVGQGDGCLVVSPEAGPDERIIIVDAGQADNMKRFLDWRFGKISKKEMRFHAAVITHPDRDHYGGFSQVFGVKRFSFNNVFHNGIVERKGTGDFGTVTDDGYLVDIVDTDAKARALVSNTVERGSYLNVLAKAITQYGGVQFGMLSSEHGIDSNGRRYVPGFAPDDSGEVKIEVIGPVVERHGVKPALRAFAGEIGGETMDPGKTKNGHSVLLRLTLGDFSLFFGGDLNSPAEDFLLRHYGGLGETAKLADGVARARERLQSLIMKSCHHGSDDVTDEFLRSVNPAAFVVSSGDRESHMHPRPELIGRLGKNARGVAPAILCTELQRSGLIQDNAKLVDTVRAYRRKLDQAPDQATRDAIEVKIEQALAKLSKRTVEVYGAITVRTDGHHLEISTMYESGSPKKKWFTMRYELGGRGGIQRSD
ncbi:MAG: hypothetical protein IPK97_01430 [Ahniella sp.]|nr:hypothetical protein [Ahniella sp.]